MPPHPQVHTGVCAIVLDHSGDRVLMIKRGGTQSYADGRGTWSFPGGWLEHGENPHKAAEREVLEETGLVVRAVIQDGFICTPSDDGERTIVTLRVRCRVVSGVAHVTEPDKCPEVEWVSVSEMPARPLFTPVRYSLLSGWLP